VVSIWTPAEEPGSRDRRSWLFDVSVALFAILGASAYASASALPLGVAFAIVVAMAAPLVLRRIWPVPVFGWAVAVAVGTGWWAMQVVWAPALVIALYTVAVLRPRRDALIAAAMLGAGVVASCIRVFPRTWVGVATSLLVVVVAATVLGLYIRTRRALMGQLHDRAERLERERGQEIALAAAAERARIVREMHDVVAHHLTVMVALAEGAAAKAETDPDRAAEVMRQVSATGRLALTDTRQLLGVLRDSEDDRRGPLPDAADLAQLIDRVRAAGLPVRYEVDGAPPALNRAAQIALYRVVQEALTNTMKHAGPGAQAFVRVGYRADGVTVEIRDDGLVTGPAGNGRGLVGMRERVAAFGGELTAGPVAPQGWQVVASWRVPA
jgi:signal transduction histidine kinase